MIHYISRLSLALIWFYHGLVPKILFKSDQEILMNNQFMPFLEKNFALISTGVLEIIYSIILVVCFHSKKVLYPSIVFSTFATIALLYKLPHLFTHAFNPFSINLAVCALSLISYISISQQPTRSLDKSRA